MKIIFEDQDEDFIKKINQDLEEDRKLALFCSERRNYSVSFEVLDIAKANAFVYGILMNPGKRHCEELEKKLGIRFTSLNYSTGDRKLEQLKSMLSNFMDQLSHI